MSKIIKTRFGVLHYVWDSSEPNSCEADFCNEDLNGLYNLWFNFGKGFHMETWLCKKHFEEFKKKFESKKVKE